MKISVSKIVKLFNEISFYLEELYEMMQLDGEMAIHPGRKSYEGSSIPLIIAMVHNLLVFL